MDCRGHALAVQAMHRLRLDVLKAEAGDLPELGDDPKVRARVPPVEDQGARELQGRGRDVDILDVSQSFQK